MGSVLIVDDEPGLRGLLEVALQRDGHAVRTAADGAEAERILAEGGIELLLTDLRMDRMDGLELLRRTRAAQPDVFVIPMTAYAERDTAVTAMRLGAYNFMTKPFDTEALRLLVRRALAARDHHLAAKSAGEAQPAVHLIGSSPAIHKVQRLIEQVSTTDSTVLITGESGTGKELAAQALHYASLRSDGPLVRINSGALAPSLLESELFGHVTGAFTGAVADRQGLFALADKGTLFLDEVGDLAAETQTKLLRVLESGEFLPVGGSQVLHCDVRVVAATNRDLRDLVAAGGFRQDLYYRLAVITIELPPLRERREDIPLLAGHLLSRHAVRLRREVSGFTPAAMEALTTYAWPGNVRELDNRIQRGTALTQAREIDAPALFDDIARTVTGMWRELRKGGGGDEAPGPALERRPPTGALRDRLGRGETIGLEDAVTAYERDLVAAALERTSGNLTEAATLLGISFRQIRYKVRQLGLRG